MIDELMDKWYLILALIALVNAVVAWRSQVPVDLRRARVVVSLAMAVTCIGIDAYSRGVGRMALVIAWTGGILIAAAVIWAVVAARRSGVQNNGGSRTGV